MLLFEQGVATLQFSQLHEFGHKPRAQHDLLGLRPQPPLAVLLAPAREHERMDIQGLRNVLHLNSRQPAELYRTDLELSAVLRYSLGLCRSSHRTPPSSVRWKCLLNRVRFGLRLSAMLCGILSHRPAFMWLGYVPLD